MFNLSPFAVLGQDKDAVIMMINYYCEKGEEPETHENAHKRTKTHGNAQKRIRVNDKTATGGWF